MSVKKVLILASALFLIVCAFAVPAAADDIRVIDGNSFFSENEIEEITDIAMEAEAETGVKFFIVTSTALYSDSEMPEICGVARQDDFCVLLIRKDLRYNFFTYGIAEKRISVNEVNEILDDNEVYDNIKHGKTFDGAKAFIRLSAKAVRVPVGTIIIVALVLGVVGCGISIGIVVGKYKMKMRPTNYPLDKYARLKLNESQDTFIGKHVAVVVTSSGGSGGGGGSGGHVSGGGNRGGR